MGNCLNAASRRGRDMLPEEEEESLSEMRRISQLLLLQQEEEDDEEYEAAAAAAEAEKAAAAAAAEEGVKVKVVLTRGELEWLMAQLKAGDGHRLQDLLHRMHAAKQQQQQDHCSPNKASTWRPCLESILECPENAAAPMPAAC